MDIKGKKLLVTGGAGFIGSALIEELLQSGCSVVCLDNFITGKRRNLEPFLSNHNFELIEGDIRNIEDCTKAVAGADIILHQAALGSVPRSVADPATTNEVNINGFLNMLIASRDAGVKRFVYASSSAVYGDHPDLPKVEEKTGNPLSPYAVTKQVKELYARVFSDLYGMEIIGLRYFNVFGRRQDPEGAYAAVVPRFIAAMIKGESPMIFGDGKQSRDFTYIDNVVQANLLAATVESREALNTVYNIAVGAQITLIDMVVMMKEILSKYRPEIAGIEPKFTETRAGDILHSHASVEKARRLLGYDPQYDMYSGMEKTVEWYWKQLKR